MSSENIGENPMHRKPKVSPGRLVRGGFRLKSVGDGRQVDIPVLSGNRYQMRRDAGG